MSRGDVDGALNDLKMAHVMLSGATAAAPVAMRAELANDLQAISELEVEVRSGDLSRAAKRASADTTLKSRRRGSERRP
jgi:hypothetical protein